MTDSGIRGCSRWLREVAVVVVFATLPAIAGAENRPNFVLFLVDDHGWSDSTPYGATNVRTPNLQRLADQGLVFTHAFVASPSCAPSRAAMLTARMPARNGAEANHTFKRDEVRSLPEDLKALGYDVAAFGKVAHGNDAVRHGFDHIDRRHDAAVVAEYLERRDRNRPLCLIVGSPEPHVPWADPDGYDPKSLALPANHFDTPATREFRARYLTDVTKADTEFGAVWDVALRALDPARTLVIYTSDHGAQWPFAKWNLYDAGIRVPFIAAWPGVIAPGTRTDAMIQWIDLLPTLIDLAGGTPPAGIDGRSFASVLNGRSNAHRDAIVTTHHHDGRMNVYPIRSIRTREYKYIRNLHPDWAHTTHIDLGGGSGDGWRYFREWVALAEVDTAKASALRRYYERPVEELYDLRADPDEQRNLAAEPAFAGILQNLRDRLDAWRAEQGDRDEVAVAPRLLSDPDSWRPYTPPAKP